MITVIGTVTQILGRSIMLECMIVGDSIAVGVARERPECVSYATGGLNTWQWNKKYAGKVLASPVVIISLGTNDHKGVNTLKELVIMRDRVNAQQVYWVLPPCNDKFCKPQVNEWVKTVANIRGDRIIETKRLQPDAIHPSWAGYKELANQTR
jgi:lysophospholipase L1-like esterase